LTRIADAKLVRSMSRKGYLPDNAACEGFFGRLKTELFYPRNWHSTTIEQFIQALDSYIRWYNEKRIKIYLTGLSEPGQAPQEPWNLCLTSPRFLPHPRGSNLAARQQAYVSFQRRRVFKPIAGLHPLCLDLMALKSIHYLT
jgi:hypothetical protein